MLYNKNMDAPKSRVLKLYVDYIMGVESSYPAKMVSVWTPYTGEYLRTQQNLNRWPMPVTRS